MQVTTLLRLDCTAQLLRTELRISLLATEAHGRRQPWK